MTGSPFCVLSFSRSINPLHPSTSMHILHTILYTFPRNADKENLLINQEFLWLLIIFILLMTLMCDAGVIMKEEIRCWSLFGVKELKHLVTKLAEQASYLGELALRSARSFN